LRKVEGRIAEVGRDAKTTAEVDLVQRRCEFPLPLVGECAEVFCMRQEVRRCEALRAGIGVQARELEPRFCCEFAQQLQRARLVDAKSAASARHAQPAAVASTREVDAQRHADRLAHILRQ
jgi:hypothetical protein